MLRMREAKAKTERNWESTGCETQHKPAKEAAKAKTPPVGEELGMQRMRKAKAKNPPKAA